MQCNIDNPVRLETLTRAPGFFCKMKISRFMAMQYARPSGIFGRVVVAAIMNRANRASNNAVHASLEIERGNRVLEVGFGGADLLFDVARNSGCSEVCGVEKSEVMLRRAQSRIQREKVFDIVKLRSGGIEALPFGKNRFDRVCSVNTVYFWPDLCGCARELARVTGDKGRVVLGFGSGEKLTTAGYTKKGFQFYHPDTIDQAMASAGLKLLRRRRLNRTNKDSFFITAYCKDGQ